MFNSNGMLIFAFVLVIMLASSARAGRPTLQNGKEVNIHRGHGKREQTPCPNINDYRCKGKTNGKRTDEKSPDQKRFERKIKRKESM